MRVVGVLGIVGLSVVVYSLIIRPWQVRWGATDAEVAREMAGDTAVSRPDSTFTRAVTINALPEKVWPWILQMGDRRAGFYSYDWFDNRGVRSAEVIVPDLQAVAVGDVIPISEMVKYRVWAMAERESIVWVSDDDPTSGSWTWGLYPAGGGQTRLVTRLSGRAGQGLLALLFHWAVDAGDIVFMRKSMLGIKQRAEGVITDSYAEDVTEGVLWGSSLLQFLAAVVLVFRRKRWFRPWLLGLAIAAVFLATFYGRPPLALGVLAQLGTLAALVCLLVRRKAVSPCGASCVSC